ncbi:MAG: hypothetical protein Q8835_02625 [Sweet potato little leaf phytoplasma]|nr:hypothetical protein [Sweet potato little leaf phytoplasma]
MNKAADALSRVPHEIELSNISVPSIIDLVIVQKEVEEDPELVKVQQEIEADPLLHTKFSNKQGKLLYKERFVRSHKSSLIP